MNAETVVTPADRARIVTVQQARRDVGRALARWRNVAGLTQVELAQRLRYSRSTVASAEIGYSLPPRPFWSAADTISGADGALLAAFDRMDAIACHHRTIAARLVPLPAAPRVDDGEQVLTVARWSGRETLALREALRCHLRAFAVLLGVTDATVSKWEDPRQAAPPTLAMQARLDGALKSADCDARARFRLLIHDHGGDDATGYSPGLWAVTPIRRDARACPASP